jgi:hypothetical protein
MYHIRMKCKSVTKYTLLSLQVGIVSIIIATPFFRNHPIGGLYMHIVFILILCIKVALRVI